MKVEEWKPLGIENLEDNALEAIKLNENEIIIAGPGAGKTELLAQKICFLLQCEICKSPKKILAISLKVDSAKNLKTRIIERIGKDYSSRFISQTFDAFFLSILKQFYKALPEQFKIKDTFNIYFIDYYNGEAQNLLDNCADEKVKLKTLNEEFFANDLENQHIVNKPLLQYDPNDIYDYVSLKLWKKLLNENKITFKMVARLVECIFVTNPAILKCYQTTYTHIILDEFQDITFIQYDILKTMFLKTTNILTAVGDDKQKIMTFAGAKENIFSDFKTDFNALQKELKNNYRSIPKLVNIQNNIIEFLYHKHGNCISKNENEDINTPCSIFEYKDNYKEAIHISYCIKKLLETCTPKDICILIRKRGFQYTHYLIEKLNELNIKCRLEDNYQKLLSEPVVNLIICALKCSLNYKYTNEYFILRNHFERFLSQTDFVKKMELIISLGKSINNENIENNINTIIELLDTEKIKSFYPQYKSSDYLEETIEEFFKLLISEFQQNNNLEYVLNEILGNDIIPIMTIHKSKGLEFENIILIGLEDNAFNHILEDRKTENCAFFVAFSRAKKRVIFTMCNKRRKQKGSIDEITTDNTKEFFDILKQAGVRIQKIDF